MSMISWKYFYLVVQVIVRISIEKNQEYTTLTRSSILSMSGDVPKVNYGILSGVNDMVIIKSVVLKVFCA